MSADAHRRHERRDVPRRRWLAAERFPQVYAAIGRHPNEATGFDDADLAELAALAAHPRCVAIGETGLDFYRDYAPRADQERAFDAQIELARTTAKPLVIHTRAADDDTIATLRGQAAGLDVILHCFSMPDAARRVRRAGLVDLLRRQRHVPQGAGPRRRRRARARRAPARRDRRAVPHAAGRAQGAQPARVRRPHGALRRRAARDRVRGARAARRAQRRRAAAW